jgi:hypothetical protein
VVAGGGAVRISAAGDTFNAAEMIVNGEAETGLVSNEGDRRWFVTEQQSVALLSTRGPCVAAGRGQQEWLVARDFSAKHWLKQGPRRPVTYSAITAARTPLRMVHRGHRARELSRGA